MNESKKGFTLETLQVELAPWTDANFGPREAWHPLLGIVEEVGELEEAIDKAHYGDIKDAIADTVIYMCDFANTMEFDLNELIVGKIPARPQSPTILVGKLAHSYLKKKQGIRGTPEEHDAAMKETLAELFHSLSQWLFETYQENLLRVVADTWSKVKERNWKRNPKTGEG